MAGIWLKTPPSARQDLALLSWDAAAAWHALRLHSAALGTDGRIRKFELHAAVDRKITEAKARKLVAELVAAGHLHDRGDHWEFPGWLDEQPTAEEFNDPVRRARWMRNKRLQRDERLCTAVKERDQHRCRYCGIRVNWAARTGNNAGQYDHVDPDGGNELGNVVVACRRCNNAKAARTPEQAGMVLLAPGTTDAQMRSAQPGLSRGSAGAQPGLSPIGAQPPTKDRPSRGSAGAQPGLSRNDAGADDADRP